MNIKPKIIFRFLVWKTSMTTPSLSFPLFYYKRLGRTSSVSFSTLMPDFHKRFTRRKQNDLLLKGCKLYLICLGG